MNLPIYHIDAFTDYIFSGNPACVVVLEEWLPVQTMLSIAQENAVAETAFLIKEKDQYLLKWFTPEIEMDLCGHATLATAHCIKRHLNHSDDQIIFYTKSGALVVNCDKNLYHMDFPSREAKPSTLPKIISQAINIQPLEVLKSRDFLLVYDNEETIRKIEINRSIFDQINLDPGGVIVTAPGIDCDFVSRFFTPQASILEDPVTGSAHCTLSPYWSDRFNKTNLIAHQLSSRGGHIYCEQKEDRVIISGNAITFSHGTLKVD